MDQKGFTQYENHERDHIDHLPDLNFNDRTIQTVVDHCRMKITPLTTYINITHLSDRSVTWSSNITVDSFKSVKTAVLARVH